MLLKLCRELWLGGFPKAQPSLSFHVWMEGIVKGFPIGVAHQTSPMSAHCMLPQVHMFEYKRIDLNPFGGRQSRVIFGRFDHDLGELWLEHPVECLMT